ncbi:MAG: TIGR01906 family membrane protein [Chloroflexi bacterium]|nr:TIGR01906 family membrane protein [Chloroflexota bacterium]
MSIAFKVLRFSPTIVFAAAFIVVLVASNVRLAFNSLQLYTWGFARQDVDVETGLTLEQLAEAGRTIRDYFNADYEPLDVRVEVAGERIPLFDEREVVHMADVKQLVQLVYRLQEGCFLFLFLWLTLGFFVQGSDFIPKTRRLLLQTSVLTMVIIGAAGVAALIAFQPLFLIFHQLSFANDFWLLDPRTSFLLRMFPQQFWIESTLLIGAATIAEALAIAVAITLLTWWRQWRLRVAQSKLPQFT